MIRIKCMRSSVTVLVAAALIFAAGGAAVASNMGFKLNYPLYPTSPTNANIGENWLSLPYNNPYSVGCTGAAAGLTCFKGICNGLGLGSAYTLTMIDADTGNPATVQTCISPTSATIVVPNSPQARAIKIRITGTVSTNAIVVGSHNPVISQILYPNDSSGPTSGQNWWSVPYHTTAVFFKDLCNQIGLPAAGSIFQRDASTGGAIGPLTCISPTAATTRLVLGQGAQIRNGSLTATTTFVPAHF